MSATRFKYTAMALRRQHMGLAAVLRQRRPPGTCQEQSPRPTNRPTLPNMETPAAAKGAPLALSSCRTATPPGAAPGRTVPSSISVTSGSHSMLSKLYLLLVLCGAVAAGITLSWHFSFTSSPSSMFTGPGAAAVSTVLLTTGVLLLARRRAVQRPSVNT